MLTRYQRITLTAHARDRAALRCPALGPNGLEAALNDRGVETTSRPLGQFVHILAWSTADQVMIVAVVNRKTGEATTVLEAFEPRTGKRCLLTERPGAEDSGEVWIGVPRRSNMRVAVELAGDTIPNGLLPRESLAVAGSRRPRLRLRYVTDRSRGVKRSTRTGIDELLSRPDSLEERALAMLAELRGELAGEKFVRVVAEVSGEGEGPIWEWEIEDLRTLGDEP